MYLNTKIMVFFLSYSWKFYVNLNVRIKYTDLLICRKVVFQLAIDNTDKYGTIQRYSFF